MKDIELGKKLIRRGIARMQEIQKFIHILILFLGSLDNRLIMLSCVGE